MAASSLLRSLTRRGCAGPGAFSHFRHQHRSPFSTGAWDEAGKWLEGFGPTAKGQKARMVVLGTGWAGLRVIKDLDTGTGGYDVVCVAPRGHMFTLMHAFPWFRFRPLEFRFVTARCTGVDTDAHTIDCETVTSDVRDAMEPWKFKIAYDKLVFACEPGASTFGIRGVTNHAIFLREVHHAQEIHRRLLLNLMLSDVPGCSEDEKRRLLHCVVVGGGPTGVEFSGELIRDVKQRYSHVKDYIHVTLIEANEILSSYDAHLRQYAINQLVKSGVRLVRGIVKDVQPNKLILSDGEEVPYGLLVWSTGVGPSSFVKSLPFPKSPGGRIGVDEWLCVPSVRDVYAIGDCSGFLESTGKEALPASAQVAEWQGKYLARKLNSIMKAGGGHAKSEKSEAIIDVGLPFVYKQLGGMATFVELYKALVDLRQSKESKGISNAGSVSCLIWRSDISWRNRLYVAALLFGRDISRI